MSQEQLFKTYQQEFLAQLPEVVDGVESLLLDLEKENDLEHSKQLLRSLLSSIHSAKGSCGIHELKAHSQIFHKVEDSLIEIQGRRGVECQAEIQACLDLLDRVRGEKPQTEVLEKPQQASLSQPRVLLVEPSKSISKVLQAFLSQNQMQVVLCRTDMEAIQQLASGRVFDYLVTSQKLQKFSGISLIALLKFNFEHKELKSILMTSDSMEFGDAEVQPDLLILKDAESYDKIAKFISEDFKSRSDASLLSKGAPPKISSRSERVVYFVDDQPEIHLIANLVFKRIPQVKVVYFENPAAVLESSSLVVPDVIVTDYQMPGLTGSQLKEKCQDKWPQRQIRYILLTGEKNPEFVKQQFKQGFEKVIDKTGSFRADLESLFK